MDSKLFNLNHFQSKTKTNIKSVTEVQYVDDCALCVDLEDLQKTVKIFSDAYNQVGLTLNTKKTEELLEQASNHP